MSVPKEIVEKILECRRAIKALGQDDFNPHGGYKYVSIDKYYTAIARTLTEKGLVWRCRETLFELVPNQGKSKDRTYVKSSMNYDVMVGQHMASDYMKITIVQPIDGAQTTGQLYSYADKVFMRVAFHVATGEKDESPAIVDGDGGKPEPMVSGVDDILEPQGNEAHQRPEETPHDPDTGVVVELGEDQKELAPKMKGGLPVLDTRKVEQDAVNTIELIFKTFMPLVKTKSALADWHAENLAALEKVAKIDPDARARIKVMFNERNTKLGKK